MPSRKRSKFVIPLILLPLAFVLFFLQLHAMDQSKITAANEGLKQARVFNLQKKPVEARRLIDQLLAQPPRVYWLKTEFQSLLDQMKLEKANALFMQNSQDTELLKLLGEIKTSPAQEEAGRLQKKLDDIQRLNQASEMAASGRWFEAEKIYTAHLNDSFAALPHRLKYRDILMRQGRYAEARVIYAEGLFALERPENGLLELAIQDNDEVLPEKWAAEIELLLGIVPDEPRLLLALANLEQWRGNLSSAERILARLVLKMPWDTPSKYGMLKNAISRGDLPNAWKSIESLDMAEPEAISACAWICRMNGWYDEEKQWLEKLIELKPVDRVSLARLAELGLQRKKPEEAKVYQESKKKAEANIVEYYRLCRDAEPINLAKATLLSQSATRLGLPFDAWAWQEIGRRGKLDPANKPVVSRKTLVDWITPDVVSRLKPSEKAPFFETSDHAQAIKFTDIAGTGGLGQFTSMVSQASGQLIPPLSSAGGLGIIDYDNDGLEDVFAVQSGIFPPDPSMPNSGDRLFRNLGHGKFEDVTSTAGIDRFPRGFGHGVAVGDIDNDGFSDLFITRWRGYALWRNRGNGTFEDVTERYGLSGDRDWPTSAAFADFDNDGDIDLYVCHYLEWIEGKAYPCIDTSKPGTYDCRPRDFPAMKDHLFRNDGGKFTDVSDVAGITTADTEGRGLGVVSVDVNDDGLMDIFVANDTTANFLFINRGAMKFEESAFASGVAANAQGGFQAGMGVAAADLNNDGLVDLTVTNFYNESTSIFQNLGAGFFVDRTLAMGVAASSRNRLGFGVLTIDFDNDGYKDILTANGHVTDGRPAIAYRMPLQLFQNRRKLAGSVLDNAESRVFVDVTKSAGEPFSRELMARGLVSADLDFDGLPDCLVQSQGDPLILLKNETTTNNRWIGIELRGTQANRDGIGAKVVVKTGDHHQVQWIVGGGSFQSASSRRIQVGLGREEKIDSMEIRWPSGKTEKLSNLRSNTYYRVIEGAAEADVFKAAPD